MASSPLNVLLVPLGTPGDVQPFADIGLAMKARGHRVTLLANQYFESIAKRNGFEFAPTGAREMYEKMLADKSLWIVYKAHRVLAKWAVVPEFRASYRAIAERYVPGNTVVAAQTMAWGARVAQEKLGVPLSTVHRQPAVLRSLYKTSRVPWMFLPDWLPRPVKRFEFWVMDQMMDRPFLDEADAFRAELNLPPIRRLGRSWMHSPESLLCFWPDWFGPIQPDWPAQTRLVGFIAKESGEREPDPSLRAFLDSGEAPVVVTFGSGVKFAASLYAMAIEACRILGKRAIFITRFREQLPAELRANMIHATYAPFSWLLPRAAAIVHHGGIGTMGQSCACGVPQIPVPGLVFDTLDNAQRLDELGVSRSIPMHRCTSERLTAALRSLLNDNAARERATELARRIHDEDALTQACDELETLAKQPRGASTAAK